MKVCILQHETRTTMNVAVTETISENNQHKTEYIYFMPKAQKVIKQSNKFVLCRQSNVNCTLCKQNF